MNSVTKPIDYVNLADLFVYQPRINEKILESLNSIIKNITMLAANELFAADVTTHHVMQILQLF